MKGGRESGWRAGIVAMGSIAQMADDLDESVLNGGLGDTNLGNVALKASNASKVEQIRRGIGGMGKTCSKPASPVRVASLEGFSKRQSRPACLQRLQGGLSAPSHLIFCFLQAF